MPISDLSIKLKWLDRWVDCHDCELVVYLVVLW